jgi:hypothetical protein
VQDTVDAERALNNAVIVQASYLENANDIQALRSMAATGFGSPRGFQTTIGGPMNRLDANAPPPPLLNRPRAAPASFAQQVGESENAFDLALGEASSACY